MRKLLLLASALALTPIVADAQNSSGGPSKFLQGQPVPTSMLNKNFDSVVRLNGLTITGACSGNSSPNGPGAATINVTCVGGGGGGGGAAGPDGAIQLNSGGLFSGVLMSGDATLSPAGVLTLNPVQISKGGTGASTVAAAQTALGISTVGRTGAYGDLAGLPTLGTIASQALPTGPIVGSNGTTLVSIPAMTGDGSWNTTTGAFTLVPVTVPKGGTGANIFTAHQLLIGQGATPVTAMSAGSAVAGWVATFTGQNTDPIWAAPTGGGGGGLSPIANGSLLANTSGFSAIPVATTQSAMLDTIGSATGTMAVRGASGVWVPIVPGAAGTCWTANGPSAMPTWQTSCSGGSSFGGTGGVVGVDANGVPFVFSLNNLTVSTGTGSGILSAGTGGGGGGGGSVLASETVNSQTGTTYTVVSSDATTLTTLNNASPVAVSLPQAGSTILSGWFADYSNLGAGIVTFTPTVSTIDGAASLAIYQGQGLRIVSDGSNYFTQRGGMSPAQIGPLINVLPGAGAAADADTFPVVQGGVASKQTIGSIWTNVSTHLNSYVKPTVTAGSGFTLDANTHNGRLVTATAAITVSLPSTLAAMGVGFQTTIFNQSGGVVTLSNAGASWGAWATSSGSLSIPNGQVAVISLVKPSTPGIVYASISTTGTGGGSITVPPAFPRISGRYYTPRISSAVTGTPVANRLYAMPIRLGAATYRGLAFTAQVAPTGTAATCRMGLYADSSGVPGALIRENVVTVAIGVTGGYYSDFTGGDYTASADQNAWVSFICGSMFSMQTLNFGSTATVGDMQTDDLGFSQPAGAVNGDVGIFSSTITTYPAVSLAATNSGNFGGVTYTNLAVPLTNIRVR